MMHAKLVLFIAAAVALLCLFLLLSSTVRESKPGKKENSLESVELIPLEGVTGPESLAFDAGGGGPYTGVSDGRILVWNLEHGRWLDYAFSPTHQSYKCRGSTDPNKEHICGRPLGLQFQLKTGKLFIADAYQGLLVVCPDEKIASQVEMQAQGKPFRFTNGLDIDQESGDVYFTDSSTRFERRKFLSLTISGDNTGRLMKYNSYSKTTEVLLNGLAFPNGVLVSKDASYLLISESTHCRVLRYWLKPPNATVLEVLAELPGFPDNLKWSPRGGFWVAMHAKRPKLLKWALSFKCLTGIFTKIPIDIERIALKFGLLRGKALALRLSVDGEILEVLDGFAGSKLRFISEVTEWNGSLWFGSVHAPFMAIHRL